MGVKEGEHEGVHEGVTDGVRLTVGSLLGVQVGVTDGGWLIVGVSEGAIEGSTVGVDGAYVGECVGALVASPTNEYTPLGVPIPVGPSNPTRALQSILPLLVELPQGLE